MPLTRITGSVVQDFTLPESKLINPYVNVSGDTMTGQLILPNNGLVVGTNQLVVSGGSVGIGTLAPDPLYKLDVNGSLRISGSLVVNTSLGISNLSVLSNGLAGSPSISFFTEPNTGIYKGGSGTVNISSAGINAFSVSSSLVRNYSGVYGVYRASSAFSTDNIVEFNSASDTYYIGRDASIINFRTSTATNRLVIDANGNVGIGTTGTISGVILNVSGRTNSSGGYAGIRVTDLPTVTTSFGGTGLTSYSAGDILYYSSGNTFSKLSAPVSSSILYTSNSVPNWTTIPLQISFGGTGITTLPDSGHLLIGTGSSFILNRLSAGSGITVVNGSGTIGIGVTNLPNSSLSNSSVTINTGSGLTGGGVLALGGTLNISNSGVTGLTAGSGITLSNSTGSILVSNSGVTSAIAGSGISVSSSIGAVTYSLDSNSTPTLGGLNLKNALPIQSGGTGITSLPAVNEILYGNNSGSYSKLKLVGVGVTISPDYINNVLTLTATLSGATVPTLSNGTSSIAIPQPNGSIIGSLLNNEIFRIDSNVTYGSAIGLGTSTPNYRLDFGTSLLGVNRAIGLVTQPSSNLFTGIGLSPLGAGTTIGIRIAGTPTSLSTSAELASIGYYSTDGNYNYTPVVLVRNDNKVGIGTSSPNYHLDVVGDINASGYLRMGVDGTSFVTGMVDTTTFSTNQVTLDTFSTSLYRGAKYLIQVINNNNTLYQTSEILVMHDSALAYMTEYGIINTGTSLGVIDSDVNSGNVRILFTPTYPNNKIRILKTLIGII